MVLVEKDVTGVILKMCYLYAVNQITMVGNSISFENLGGSLYLNLILSGILIVIGGFINI
jgi:hypothetical protein